MLNEAVLQGKSISLKSNFTYVTTLKAFPVEKSYFICSCLDRIWCLDCSQKVFINITAVCQDHSVRLLIDPEFISQLEIDSLYSYRHQSGRDSFFPRFFTPIDFCIIMASHNYIVTWSDSVHPWRASLTTPHKNQVKKKRFMNKREQEKK